MRRLKFLWRDSKLPVHWLKAVVASLCYGFPVRKLSIVGVTGTDGKTTTSTLIYHFLQTAGYKVALVSTVAAFIGTEEIDTGFHVTSPSPFALQRLLRRLVKEGYTYLVLEATSHGIHQHRVWGIHPAVGVLTNITHEHLDYHGTYTEYLKVKASFLLRAKLALINKKDKSFKQVQAILQNARVAYKGYSLDSLTPTLHRAIQDRFPEEYNRMNATAACLAAEVLGVTEKVCLQALHTFQGVKGRMEFVGEVQGINGIVDFAHTPNALNEALHALRAKVQKKGRLIAVFGAAGERDSSKRPLMGQVASELADEVVLTAEDPRTESVYTIIRQLKEGVHQNYGHVFGIADRRQAIQFAVQKLAKPGDIVAVFGKGHEKSMNYDGKHEVPWSDQEELRSALQQRSSSKHAFTPPSRNSPTVRLGDGETLFRFGRVLAPDEAHVKIPRPSGRGSFKKV